MAALTLARRHPAQFGAGAALLLLALGHAIPATAPFAGWIAAALMIGVLTQLHQRDGDRVRAQRGELFADCLGLFDTYRVTQEGAAYPVLQGRYRGAEVRLEPVVDHIAWRKLPSLWLKVTVLRPTAYQGVLDLMVRPQGVEFYSPNGDLEHRLPLPAGWPEGAMFSTDNPAAMPPLKAVEPHVALFEDPQMKELLVTPNGVRLVRQIWQGERAHYLVLRQVRFAESRIQPGVAHRLLDAALALSDSVSAASPLARIA